MAVEKSRIVRQLFFTNFLSLLSFYMWGPVDHPFGILDYGLTYQRIYINVYYKTLSRKENQSFFGFSWSK